jgi:hypothetical protein
LPCDCLSIAQATEHFSRLWRCLIWFCIAIISLRVGA